MIDPLQTLCKKLHLQFDDKSLLQTALTHRSASSKNYERLEYLGDSALNFIIATAIYKRNPNCDEGSLSRLRASLVRGKTLGEIAREHQLGDFLILGPGELKSDGFLRGSILADVVEAIIGAVYLDKGFDECRQFVLGLYENRLESLPDVSKLVDPKTRLQEYLQGGGLDLPSYSTLDVQGKSHQQIFHVDCTVSEYKLRVDARSTSRRKAEQAAASLMLEQLQSRDDKP